MYYNLNQLLTNNLTDLKLRQLKNRMKLVSEMNLDNKLLYKEGRIWQIHKSLLFLFKSKWIKRKELRTEITINLSDNYDKDYYTDIANEIASNEPKAKLTYSIETNYDNKPHIHIGTTLTIKQSKRILKQLDKTRDFVILSNMNTRVAPIENLTDYLCYISKEVEPIQLNS